MSESLRIASSSWTTRSEASLDSFSTTSAAIVSVKEDYPLVETQAKALTDAATAYHLAYSRHKQFGGTDNKEAKDVAKALLYEAHQALVTKLEETASDNRDYLVRPGYHIDLRGGTPSTAKVSAPWAKKAVSNQVRGKVQFILGATRPREIKGIVGRCSTDNGATWHNGIYSFGLNFTLEDQPSGKGVLYQYMYTATGNRESDWSAPIYVDVF